MTHGIGNNPNKEQNHPTEKMEFELESESCVIEQSFNERYSRYAREALDELPDNFTITDPSIPGHPIIFASLGFLKMTGYTRDEVVGKSGAMFQGPGTCRRAVMEIREAIREERKTQVVLLNYRKDRTPFWMLFHMTPVFTEQRGGVVHFVAVQVPLHRKRRSLGEDGSRVHQEFVFGCCRKEVCSDSILELGRLCSMDQVLDERDVRGLCFHVPALFSACFCSFLLNFFLKNVFSSKLSVILEY